MIPLEQARWRLALIWFPACGLLFLLLVIQSMGGAYGDDLPRAWGWALPNFVPTLSLMISVFAGGALVTQSTKVRVRRNFLALSMSVSIFYLVILFLSVLAQPVIPLFNTTTTMSRIEMLETSNLWLGPLQGLVVIALGVLFFLKEDQKGPAATSVSANR